MAEVKTYEALQDLIIREQFMDICNKELAMYLKEKQYILAWEICASKQRDSSKLTTRTSITTAKDKEANVIIIIIIYLF